MPANTAPEQYEKYEKTVTLACVNYKPIWGDKAANLDKMKGIITTAAAQGNNIIVFPELALTGFDCNPERTHHKSTAETIPGPATEEISRIAREHDVYVIFGMPERDKDKPDTLYIAAPLIGPEGLIGAYRKIHISTPPLFTETDCFTGGSELPVFETRYGLIGIQICYDFWFFPELTRILALKGAEIIINSCGSPTGPNKGYFIVQQTGCRATENTVFAATANLVGKDLTTTYCGYSCIVGPNMPQLVNIFAEAGQEEQVISATLNMERLRIAHRNTNWYKDRRSDVITQGMSEFVK